MGGSSFYVVSQEGVEGYKPRDSRIVRKGCIYLVWYNAKGTIDMTWFLTIHDKRVITPGRYTAGIWPG